MDKENFDEGCVTDDSSASNRTYMLSDVSFPSLTPRIDSKDDLKEAKSTTPLLDGNGRPKSPNHFVTKLGRLSISSSSKATPLPSRPYQTRQSSIIPPSVTATPLRTDNTRVSLRTPQSAFERRKAYDRLRRSSLAMAPNHRIDPRKRAAVRTTSVAVARQRQLDTTVSRRTVARRQLVDRNRVGLDSS